MARKPDAADFKQLKILLRMLEDRIAQAVPNVRASLRAPSGHVSEPHSRAAQTGGGATHRAEFLFDLLHALNITVDTLTDLQVCNHHGAYLHGALLTQLLRRASSPLRWSNSQATPRKRVVRRCVQCSGQSRLCVHASPTGRACLAPPAPCARRRASNCIQARALATSVQHATRCNSACAGAKLTARSMRIVFTSSPATNEPAGLV